MQEKAQRLANVISELTRHEVFRVGPVEITSTVVNTWIVMAVLFLIVYLLTRSFEEKPRGAQTLFELAIEFLYSLIADSGMGVEGRRHLPVVGTFFTFILCLNLSWFIPGMVPPTTDLMTTAALGVTAVLIVQAAALLQKGPKGYLRHFAQPVAIMIPMNLVEELVKPFSLAVRLFGNMFGEKMVATILFILAPLLAPTPVLALGVLMGAIQAFIFTVLVVSYLASATQGH